MVKRFFILFTVISLLIVACGKSNDGNEVEEICYSEFEVATYSELPDSFYEHLTFTEFKTIDKEYMVSDMDKVIYSFGKFYALDWRNRKIVVFHRDGTPISVFSKMGRGPQEYLQITDFDVDDRGSLWIVDGQSDNIFHYDSVGTFIKSVKCPFQIGKIKYAKPNTLLLNTEPWDESTYKNNKVIIADTNLVIKDALPSEKAEQDPNFVFGSAGFTCGGSEIFFHSPIDDDVICLDKSGKEIKTYHFDFGIRAVPKEIMTDIEKHISEINHSLFLVKSIYIDDDVILGSIHREGTDADFIIDRKENKIYYQDEVHQPLSLVAISDGLAIYRIIKYNETPIPFLPESINSCLDEGYEVLASCELKQLNRLHLFTQACTTQK